MDVELRRLRHLIALAEHGNFGRAAAACYITQPALSRSIQALEAQVGATLFDRHRTGVELTDMGRLLLHHAVTLEAGARDLDREVRLAKDLELGELRIGVGPWGGSVLVAPVIGQLHAQHPGLTMQVVVTPWRELPPRLRARDVDIAVASVAEIEELDDFEVFGLTEHDVVVVCRAGHPLSVHGAVTLSDVFEYPLVGPGLGADAAEQLAGLAGARAGSPAATGPELFSIECDSSDVLRRLLLTSDAVTFLPRFVVDTDVQDGRLVILTEVDLGLRVRFGAAWLPGRTLGGAGTRFLDLLQAHDAACSETERTGGTGGGR
jgi:DNA-binding transcriptional LysR family regulator